MDAPKVILVTGASIGLGLSISRRLINDLHRRNYHLILTARQSSLSRFEAGGVCADDRVWIRPLDVTDADQRNAIVDEAESRFGCVDVLINNAGVSYRSCVEHVTEPERLHQMNINFRSPIELARAVLPAMRQKRRGRIINISSVSGMMAMPTMSVYSASKFALEGASEALFYEVRPWNISVTLMQPGFMRSDAFEKVPYTAMSRSASLDPNDPYHAHYQHMSGFIAKAMKWAPATPDSVANKVCKVVESRRPPLRVHGGVDALLFSMLRRTLPMRLYNGLLYRGLPKIRSWGN